MRVRFSCILFLLCFVARSFQLTASEKKDITTTFLSASSDSTKYKKRKLFLAGSSALATAGSLIYLENAWYKPYNTGKFHFFNDNTEWLQMDKAGHVFSNYQISRLMMNSFEWAGFKKKQKLFIGGSMGFAYMTAIEVMDGFSEGWGFSGGDMCANLLGTSVAIAQEAAWNEQRVQLKFSFSRSGLAQYNPSLLGKNIYTQLIKDYNGQTYWLSLNPSSFIKKDKIKFPRWLNIAFGYSAYGMLGARYNNITVEDADGNVLKFERERRFYISLDIDLTRINTKSRFLKGLFSALNIIKIPAPSIEFNSKGIKGYLLYF